MLSSSISFSATLISTSGPPIDEMEGEDRKLWSRGVDRAADGARDGGLTIEQ